MQYSSNEVPVRDRGFRDSGQGAEPARALKIMLCDICFEERGHRQVMLHLTHV